MKHNHYSFLVKYSISFLDYYSFVKLIFFGLNNILLLSPIKYATHIMGVIIRLKSVIII